MTSTSSSDTDNSFEHVNLSEEKKRKRLAKKKHLDAKLSKLSYEAKQNMTTAPVLENNKVVYNSMINIKIEFMQE